MELKNIRGANLARWIRDDPHAKGVVTAWCDHYSQFLRGDERPFNPQHIRNLAKPAISENESFGEKMARKVERAMGRPAYSLDQKQNAEAESLNQTTYENAPDELSRVYKRIPDSRKAVVDYLLGLESPTTAPPGLMALLDTAELLIEKNKPEPKKNTAA